MDMVSQENIEERLSRAQKELNVLYEVSCAMRTTLELNHILYIILTGVTSHSGLGYNRATLFLVNPKTRQLECKMAIGPDSGEHANKIWNYIQESNQDMDDLIRPDKLNEVIFNSSLFKVFQDVKFPLQDERSLIARAYHRGLPWHLQPEEIANYLDDPLLKIFQTNELVVMPLRAKDHVNGIIVADNIYTKKPITNDDLKIFTMMADQAGLAIENSQLYEQVVYKSHTDTVTNLWNHGFFQEKLSAELRAAKEHNRFLSLLIIDIDDFKKLNDAYGHQYGDAILKEIAQILKESSREIDFVCRYGGEEFAIMLLHTNKQHALDIAERVRSRIEGHHFIRTPNQQQVKITVSLGVSCFPEDAAGKEDLIAKADKAMYIAKFSGKNQVCPAESKDSNK